MKLAFLYLMCSISQGSKGVYSTLLTAKGYDDQSFYITAAGSQLIESQQAQVLHKIDRKDCRIVMARPVLQERSKNGSK